METTQSDKNESYWQSFIHAIIGILSALLIMAIGGLMTMLINHTSQLSRLNEKMMGLEKELDSRMTILDTKIDKETAHIVKRDVIQNTNERMQKDIDLLHDAVFIRLEKRIDKVEIDLIKVRVSE